MIIYDISSICEILNTLIKVCYGFQHILAIWVHTLELCVPKWVTISLTLFGLQYDVWTHYSLTVCDNLFGIYFKTTGKKGTFWA